LIQALQTQNLSFRLVVNTVLHVQISSCELIQTLQTQNLN